MPTTHTHTQTVSLEDPTQCRTHTHTHMHMYTHPLDTQFVCLYLPIPQSDLCPPKYSSSGQHWHYRCPVHKSHSWFVRAPAETCPPHIRCKHLSGCWRHRSPLHKAHNAFVLFGDHSTQPHIPCKPIGLCLVNIELHPRQHQPCKQSSLCHFTWLALPFTAMHAARHIECDHMACDVSHTPHKYTHTDMEHKGGQTSTSGFS